MAQLKIAKLKKSFGKVDVLKDIDISIEDGEFVALIGPSGCGKSTLLRSIAGLEEVSSGEILLGDRSIVHVPPKHRNVAMVFQNYALYPHMTVEENMGFSLMLAKLPADQIAKKVKDAADILGLQALLGRKPKELSGGQRQRVAMGRAIVRSPEVFLFDEPLSNLDAKLRVQMRTEIRRLHQKLGTTTVFVTHDQIEAMTMADRIVVLRDGKVEQVGTPLELFDHPRNVFVAEFIGSPSMNMLRGEIRDQSFLCDTGEILPLPYSVPLQSGAKLVLGVRPTDIVVDPAGRGVSVEIVEHNGSETYCQLRDGNLSYGMVSTERLDVRVGQEICVSMRSANMHLFDAETGLALERPAVARAEAFVA
jgi:multiple sugar transport system ATP-binding protein